MKPIDPIESLQELLEAGLPRATEPSVAKIQLAGLYYVTKALRAAKAAQVLIGGGYLFESFLLIRSLYNATVDFLWLCQDPEPRAERFYDSTAVP